MVCHPYDSSPWSLIVHFPGQGHAPSASGGHTATEFSVLGLIAGFIASLGAEIILYFVQLKVFDMQPSLHPELWSVGVVSGVLLITVLGLLRSREIITVPPLQSLRQIS